jgi:hypothetical protein
MNINSYLQIFGIKFVSTASEYLVLWDEGRLLERDLNGLDHLAPPPTPHPITTENIKHAALVFNLDCPQLPLLPVLLGTITTENFNHAALVVNFRFLQIAVKNCLQWNFVKFSLQPPKRTFRFKFCLQISDGILDGFQLT